MTNSTNITTPNQSYIQIMNHLYHLDNLLQIFHSNSNIYLLDRNNYEGLDKKFENMIRNINFTRDKISPIYCK
ncbi:MAG: hypothetical protein ACJATU_000363 [Rickettsiales bacterium]|jgi:hypothetical protein